MKNKDLKKALETEIVQVDFSVADVLRLHAVASMWDGRATMTKLLRKRISPVAMKLIEERKELQ